MKPSRKVWALVAFSIIWAVGAGIHTYNADVQRAENFAKYAYKVCTDGKKLHHDSDLSSCDSERAKNIATWMEGSNGNVAIVALAPIPFAWLAAFILLYIVRAQAIGFRAVIPWATLTPFKRLFVGFCALLTGAAVLFGVVVLMNLYTDTKVPVGLNPFLDVVPSGENLLTVTGTWTRTDLTGDTIVNPLQRSKIECDKQQYRCTEALASVSETLLVADVVDYDIQSWTQDVIVLRREYPCAIEVFTIDLNTKTASGAGHRVNDGWP